jgi:hypothetical protein
MCRIASLLVRVAERKHVSHTLPSRQYTQHGLKHVLLPQHCKTYNNVFLVVNLQKCNLSHAQYKLPAEGPGGPKHVAANVGCFNVNFNILYV